MKILGISGKRKAGKDTLCRFLINAAPQLFAEKMVKRIGLADPIKEYIIHGFDVPRHIAYGEDEDKQMQLPHAKKGVTVRDGCKVVGKMFCSLEPDYWIRHFSKACQQEAKYNSRETIIICPDVRKPKEVDFIQAAGGKVIRLMRAPVVDAHITETALDNFIGFDEVISDCSIAEVQTKAIYALNDWGWLSVPA